MDEKYADVIELDKKISMVILFLGALSAIVLKLGGYVAASRTLFFMVAGFVIAVNGLVLILRRLFP